MNFKLKEICELIKVCGASGVTELKVGELHVQFSSKAHGGSVSSGIELPIIKNTDQLVETEQEVILRDEIKLKQDQLDLALIESPAEYERLLMSGELEDEKAQYR